ncbi:ABC transporter permease [Lagierella sp.]|uniref:ABC transporter permease n=1 Tax=Lagierella sp. TaxID=2849657 RepID=UPI002611FA8E|nr:ABC transporter permease [Lagierella sp.]
MKKITKRLGIIVAMVIGISMLMFVLMQMIPGNPYSSYIKQGMSPEQIENMLRNKGYYDPLPVKFGKWFLSFIRFDFGNSIQYNRPVIKVILERIPNTIMLTIPSLIFAVILSVLIGRYVAFKGGFIYKLVDVISMVGISMPTFLIAIILIKWLAFDNKIFPISGTGELAQGSKLPIWLNRIYHGVLPVIVLTFIQFSALVRYVIGFMKRVRNEDYIKTYRGFGMTEYRAYKKIGFKNIAPKLLIMVLMEVPGIISGMLITETVFVWPGIGRLNYDAVMARDYPLILGIIMIISVMVLISNLIADILSSRLDRRLEVME